MAIIGRLLLRLIVVSIGTALATVAGIAVACVANWKGFVAMAGFPPDSHGAAEFVLAGAMVFVLIRATFVMLMPAVIGILVAETFAIRSWIFHALNGAVSIWVGWGAAMGDARIRSEFYDDPLTILATGVAAGFVYWLIAGSSAGVMKPAPASPPGPAAGTATPP